MSEDELYSLPDSSIVDIVESYIKLKSLGLSDMEVFNEIEDLRSIIAGRGELPDHLTLNNYIKYRLSHDLGFLSVSFYARASFDDDFIDESIKEVLAFFQQK